MILKKVYNYSIDRKENKSMVTGNVKRIEFENLKDAMRIAKALLKNGYQVYMNIEDEIGDGKIIVVIEYEFVNEDLANGHYIYKSFTDEAQEEAKNSQKKNIDADESYRLGHAEGYQTGWTAGYQKRVDEETADDYDRESNGIYSEGYEDGYSNGYEEGYSEGYDTGLNEGDIDGVFNDE